MRRSSKRSDLCLWIVSRCINFYFYEIYEKGSNFLKRHSHALVDPFVELGNGLDVVVPAQFLFRDFFGFLYLLPREGLVLFGLSV